MSESETVELSSLNEDRYARVLCYPHVSSDDLSNRITELSQLGVDKLCFKGSKEICGLPVLGKGCVGIVVIGVMKGEPVAVKILRTDANRRDLNHEATMLNLANTVGVGPNFVGCSGRILLTRYIKGTTIPYWIAQQRRRNVNIVRETVAQVLLDCFKMDQLGLDHGELSRASKHILIENDHRPVILDFETASSHRKVANLTSVCRYLFLSADPGATTRRLVSADTPEHIIEALKRYKREPTFGSLESVVRTCGLGSGNLGQSHLP